MTNEIYLIAEIDNLLIGCHCKDVLNVYTEEIKITRMFYQTEFFMGVTRINNETMHVLDFRKRIGMPSTKIQRNDKKVSLITFETSVKQYVALIVDHILGLEPVADEKMVKHDGTFGHAALNIDLLFPVVATRGDGSMIHILDVTYLEKTQPIEDDDCGELELF
jgi:chemotaxis signal transduction protein